MLGLQIPVLNPSSEIQLPEVKTKVKSQQHISQFLFVYGDSTKITTKRNWSQNRNKPIKEKLKMSQAKTQNTSKKAKKNKIQKTKVKSQHISQFSFVCGNSTKITKQRNWSQNRNKPIKEKLKMSQAKDKQYLKKGKNKIQNSRLRHRTKSQTQLMDHFHPTHTKQDNRAKL